jgi:hypothetical protein
MIVRHIDLGRAVPIQPPLYDDMARLMLLATHVTVVRQMQRSTQDVFIWRVLC